MKNTVRYSGIMTSYVCSAECAHCMYCSSPGAGHDFITADASERIAETLERAGVRSMHIGGGEPFLEFGSLCGLLRAMLKHNIGVDYIETNAFWCRSDDIVRERLDIVERLGVRTVMVSVDPFHIEYVPLERPLRLVRLLKERGMDYFIWQERFTERLLDFDRTKTVSRDELKKKLGEHYAEETALEYGLGINGRALILAGRIYNKKPAGEFLSAPPCTKLLDGRHCHIDLYENYIPSGCPGISVAADDYFAGRITEEKYPVVSRLLRGGVAELYGYAADSGFVPSEDGYVTKCELCYFMRDHLRKAKPSRDIAPECFYKSMTAAYAAAAE